MDETPTDDPHPAAEPPATAELPGAGEEPEPVSAAEAARGLLTSRPMLFPNAYAWLMLLSALDIMLTWVILSRGGREVNALADWVIQRFSLNGMIVYKFALVLFFVVVCELVGRLRVHSGRTLSRAGVLIGSVPVVWSLLLLYRHTG